MRAVVFAGPGKAEVREVDIPRPGPREVLVRVAACGICGTDVHGYRSGMIVPGCVMGHEYSGWAEEVGEGVERIREGDLVAGNSVLSCGACEPCRQGDSNFCRELRILGVNADGALAEYVVAPERGMVGVPDGAAERLALAEPLAIAVRAWRKAGLQRGDACLITGAGPIGLLALLLARLAGVRAIVSEVRPGRAALAAQLGADKVVDPTTESLPAAVGSLAGRGVAAVIECSAAPAAIAGAPATLRPGGRLVVVGLCDKPVPTDYLALIGAEITVESVLLNTMRDFSEAVSLITAGFVDAGALISRTVDLDEVPAVLESLADGDGIAGEDAKVLVRPS